MCQINNQVRNGQLDPSSSLVALAYGPQKHAYEYSGCIVNGVRFHSLHRDVSCTTQNYGIVVPGEHGDDIVDFYGVLQSVLELIYRPRRRTVLFECRWFDTNARKRRIQFHKHLTSINVQRYWYKDDPYIFCTQARSVMYMPDPKLGNGWMVVEKLQHRGIWDKQEKESVSISVFQQVSEDFEVAEKIFHLPNNSDKDIGTEDITLTRENIENIEIFSNYQMTVEMEDEDEFEDEGENEFESSQETSNSYDDEVTYNSD